MYGQFSFRENFQKWATRVLSVAALVGPTSLLAAEPVMIKKVSHSNECLPTPQFLPPVTVPSTVAPAVPPAPSTVSPAPKATEGAVPEFQAPERLDLTTTPQPLSSTQSAGTSFNGNLQSGVMMASTYAPGLLGDGFGGGAPTTIYTTQMAPQQTVNVNGMILFNATPANATTLNVAGTFAPVGQIPSNAFAAPFVLNSGGTALTLTIPQTATFGGTTYTLNAPTNLPANRDFIPTQSPVVGAPGALTLLENPTATQYIKDNILPQYQTLNGAQLVDVIFNSGAAQNIGAGDGDATLRDVNPSDPNRVYRVTQDYTLVYAAQPVAPPTPLQDLVPGGSIAAAPSAQIGRVKLSENVSPIPRDRVYVNYSYFDNTPLYRGGVNVNRVTPGFEKTFLDGRMSFEMRAPFATTLDSTVTDGGITNTNNAEFGNLTMYLKSLLYTNEVFALSGGLGVTAPTADDFVIRNTAGTSLVHVDNQSVHLLPFVGGLYAPNERFYAQGFLQFDVDSNGNPVAVSQYNGTAYTGQMTRLARPHDATYMYFDLGIGYWVFLDRESDRWITGVSPMMEYHLNQSVGGAGGATGTVTGMGWNFTSPGTYSNSNAVVGVNFLIRNSATLSAGYATPLGGHNSQFDGEFRLTYNWLFGRSRPANRFVRPTF